MAEPLRRVDDFKLDEHPDSPNPNSISASQSDRGEYLLQGDEVDLDGSDRRLLEPYDEAKERSWPLGRLPRFDNAASRFRSQFRELVDRVQDYADEWKDRVADMADNAQHSAGQMNRRVRETADDWQERARLASEDLKQRSAERARALRRQTEEFMHERPAQAIAVAAGVGFLIGVALRLGKSRREY